MQTQAAGSQWQSPNNSNSKPLVRSAEGNGTRTQPGAASLPTGAWRTSARGEQRWPRSAGRLAAGGRGQPAPRSPPRPTPGACRAHPSPLFPLENRELLKTLLKNDALPKPRLIHPPPVPRRAQLQPHPEEGTLHCAPSYWRKSHFYLSKTTFPFYRRKKKDRPHLSALHNPAAASKAMFTREKHTGQTLHAWFPDCNGMQHSETEKTTTVAGISQIQGSPVWRSSHLGRLRALEGQSDTSAGKTGRTTQSGFSIAGRYDPAARFLPCRHSP